MKVFVVSYVMDCENEWVSAVFINRDDAEAWVKNQEQDNDDYSRACGHLTSSDMGSHHIEEFQIRESSTYTEEDIAGLRTNYEKVLKPRGYIPSETSNYRMVS